MKFKSSILLILFVFIFCINLNAADLKKTRSLFYQGNNYYSTADYAKAITTYEKALSSGYESGPFYYNLANAYFKNKQLGKAVLNYLRAQEIMPKDADLKSNLYYAQSFVKNRTIKLKEAWFKRALSNINQTISLDGITLISAILYLLLAIMIIGFILRKSLNNIFKYSIFGVGSLLLISFLLFFMQFQNTMLKEKAVVIVNSADSKFEPFSEATTFFTLNEGESVFITKDKNGWCKIRRIDGKQGWVKKSDIELL
ncbi:MAG: SH3 domain-containing protein [Candidatus Susulua stagnicola]|nr:SH3 domain-containing protein [Candidatus Susulua stagnicola]